MMMMMMMIYCCTLSVLQYYTVGQSVYNKNQMMMTRRIWFLSQEPMKSRAPQLHLEYRFYKQLGQAGKLIIDVLFIHFSVCTLNFCTYYCRYHRHHFYCKIHSV